MLIVSQSAPKQFLVIVSRSANKIRTMTTKELISHAVWVLWFVVGSLPEAMVTHNIENSVFEQESNKLAPHSDLFCNCDASTQ